MRVPLTDACYLLVCLSILGTWAGPGWNGAYSTLLQILVSIQGRHSTYRWNKGMSFSFGH